MLPAELTALMAEWVASERAEDEAVKRKDAAVNAKALGNPDWSREYREAVRALVAAEIRTTDAAVAMKRAIREYVAQESAPMLRAANEVGR